MTKNFIYLSPCKLGEDIRVLGYLKMKHGEQECYTLLKYANTEINQFCYIGKGGKKDLGLPLEEGSTNITKKTKQIAVLFSPMSRQKRKQISLPKIKQVVRLNLLMSRCWSGIIVYKKVNIPTNRYMKNMGQKKSAIKKRMQRINQRKEKEGTNSPVDTVQNFV